MARGLAPVGMTAILALTALLRGVPAAGQLPSASAAALGMGGLASASARGFAAVGSNPAGLAMPRASKLTLALLPVSLACAMRPVTCGDLKAWEGRDIPDPVREGWLERIEGEGRESGSADAHLTVAAASLGPFGFQLTTSGLLDARMNPHASELLLFGNAGRTGEPHDFQFGGSSFDAFLVSTAALAAALPLDVEIGDAPGQSFAVGAALKLSVGHLLFLARDLGTTFTGEPFEVGLRFPLMQTDTAYPSFQSGMGIGLDLGFQWEAERWGAGLVLKNLVQTFAWDVEALYFRPGTALFDLDKSDSDFRARPAAEAPSLLLEPVRAFGFGRALGLGVVHRPRDRLTVTGELQARPGGRNVAEASVEMAAGIEYLAARYLPLRAHAGIVTGGARLGGGATVAAGRFRLSGAVSWLTGRDAAAWMGMIALSLGGS